MNGCHCVCLSPNQSDKKINFTWSFEPDADLPRRCPSQTKNNLLCVYDDEFSPQLIYSIADLMDGPNIHSGDVKAFCLFGLHVRSLVSMLEQLGQKGTTELECGSHVSRLMSKLPHDLRSSFKRYTHPLGITIPTLLDFAEWLEYELQVQGDHTDYTPQSKQVSLVQRKEKEETPSKLADPLPFSLEQRNQRPLQY